MISILCYIFIVIGCSTKSSTDTTQKENTVENICTNNVNINLPAPGFEVYSVLSDPSRSVRAHQQSYTDTIADVHLHWGKKNNNNTEYFNQIGNALQKNNIGLTVFMPKPGDPNAQLYDQVATMIGLDRKGIKVFFGGDYLTSWLNTSCVSGYADNDLETIKNRLESDLNNPQCSGIGELGLFHFEKWAGQSVYKYQPNFQPFLDFMDIINQKKAWLDIHAEPFDRDGTSYENMVFGMLALIHNRNPDIRLIIAHSGMTNPVNAERILSTYPNVMMNIKLVTDEWTYLEPINNPKGEFFEDWAQLFEKMPERFMIGTDAKFKDDNGFTEYDNLIALTRLALGSLDAVAAKKIGFGNAVGIFE
jgi:hypothetical protein